MRTTALAATVLGRLTSTYGPARDPERAGQMSAYMRDQFTYLGIPAPALRTLSREVLAGLDAPGETDLRDVALGCWALTEREYQYFACTWLRRQIRVCSSGFLDTAHHLIIEKSWWDTVDPLAAHIVGPLVAADRTLVTTMDAWSVDENRWLVRTAILHQLRYREATDAKRLFHYCSVQAGHTDFFVRKAIGWALREYAKTDPIAVRDFVRAHHERLSGLSVREALKHL